ncbi:hypothetical protein [Cellulomonas sp. NTE-D12]|uniref:three-helix bundle dimerization domain-containing protein n=1 Tax=Cellulomonas sp. NTE-D12 TaxID=2962632 RepID=UPI0030815ECA
MATEAKAAHTLDEVVERVAARHPEVDRLRVRERVGHHIAHFEDARVRDFVPLLVEHRVLDELRGAHRPTIE